MIALIGVAAVLFIILILSYVYSTRQTDKAVLTAESQASATDVPDGFFEAVKSTLGVYDWRLVNGIRIRAFRNSRHPIIDDDPYHIDGYCPIAAICDDPVANYKPYLYGDALGYTEQQVGTIILVADGAQQIFESGRAVRRALLEAANIIEGEDRA